MILLSKMIRRTIYLIVACCLGCIYLVQASEIEREAEEGQAALTAVSSDIQAYIIKFLAQAKNAKAAIDNIRAFASTSKHFHDVIYDSKVLRPLIEKISRHFNEPLVKVAQAFSTPKAPDWLKDYIKQHLGIENLLEAAKAGNEDKVQALINAGIDVNVQGENGRTPLYEAAKNGKPAMVAFLLAHGADVHKVTWDGSTPLHGAAWAGMVFMLPKGREEEYINIIKLLLEAGADVNAKAKEDRTPLKNAMHFNNKRIAELLREHGAIE